VIEVLLLDAGWMGLLLLAGQWVRARSRLAQALCLPSAVIAGLLGLLLGPQVAGVLPLSAGAAEYAWLLVIVLFASLPFSSPPVRSPREVLRRAGGTFCFNLGAEIALFGAAMVVGGAVLALFFPAVSESFALLLPAGFVGGHGYAGAIGSTLEEAGVEGAVSVGYTFATVGLLSAVSIGVPLIRLARRRGWVAHTGSAGAASGERTGLVPPGNRQSLGEATTSGSSIDALAFHLAPIAAAAMLGIYASRGVSRFASSQWDVSFHVPEVATAMLCGVALKLVLGRLGLGGVFLDQRVAERIGGTATDWLIGFGLATLKLSVVAAYWMPITAMCVIGWTACLSYLFLVSRRVHDRYWFERGIFVFGWTTGVVAMGIALLRMVDPDMRSETLPSYGLAYSLIAPIELALIAGLPVLVLGGHLWLAGGALVLASLLLVFGAARLRGSQGVEAKPEPLGALEPTPGGTP
jgi:glutamate:Na+ symporter, ESS family